MKLEDILKQKKKMYIVGSKDDKISFDILIVLTVIEEYRIDGYALRFCASGNNGKDIYLSYISDFTIKWDACSHFCFYGQDTLLDDPTREESYYHICGIYSYSVMIDTYLALVQISKAHFTESINVKILNLNTPMHYLKYLTRKIRLKKSVILIIRSTRMMTE